MVFQPAYASFVVLQTPSQQLAIDDME